MALFDSLLLYTIQFNLAFTAFCAMLSCCQSASCVALSSVAPMLGQVVQDGRGVP